MSPVRVAGWLAGGRVIRVKAAKSLTQLVEQFDGLPGPTFAQRLIYAG